MLCEGRLRWIKSYIARNASFFDRYAHSDAQVAMAVKFLLEMIPEVERLRASLAAIAELRAAFDDAHDALMQARQESYFVREYLDEARDWIETILEEAEASPHTLEEWRNGLCRGSIEAVMTKCKAALSELPQGSEVVFTVRQRLADGEKAVSNSDSPVNSQNQLTD